MVWGALEDAVATPCGLIWNCILVVGAAPPPPHRPSASVAAGPSASYSLLLSLVCSAFSPFSLCRLGFAAGEAGSFALGEVLYQAGRNVSSCRKSMVWGMALVSQSQPSSRVSGRRKSVL